MTLSEIAEQEGTDKSPLAHGYTDVYEKYLGEWRTKQFTLLEIGVFNGASLRMWKRYFPYARIVGLDIHEKPPIPGCDIYQGDQTTWVPTFHPDIVIDDGGHTWSQQVKSFQNIFPMMKSGGIYFIEDLHTSYMSGQYMDSSISAIDWFKGRVDAMNRVGDPGLAQHGASGFSFIHFWRFLCAVGKS